MSLKFNKHIILCFCVLMMLLMMSTSFATDVNDDANGVSVSTEDVVVQSSENSVMGNTSNLASISEYNNIRISQNGHEEIIGASAYDYETTPSPSSVDYTLGESKIITVNVDSDYLDYISSYDSMQVFINGASTGIDIPNVSADSETFTFDLKTISSKLVNGKNTLTFHPDENVLYDADIYNTNYNTLVVQVGQVAEKFLYVSTTGSDDNGNGSETNPYATITKAISVNSANGGGYTIIVNSGNYSLSSSNYITDGLTIKGIGNVVISAEQGKYHLSLGTGGDYTFIGLTFINGDGTAGAISTSSGSGSGSLKVYNCTFINNIGSYSTIKSYITTIVQGCTFINNTCKGSSSSFWGIINSVGSGTFELTNNIFLDNIVNANAPIIANTRSTALNANNNYWGSNDGISSSKLNGNIDLSSWAGLVTSIDNNDVCVGDKATITTQFKSTTDGKTFSDLAGVMPNFTVTTTSAIGTVASNVVISNNTGNITYSATKDGKEKVDISYNGELLSSIEFNVDLNIPGSIYVSTTGSDDTGDGSKDNPYATISKALDMNDGTNTIIVSEGNYILSGYRVAKSVTIIGKGNVVITPSGNTYILFISTSANKVNLTGLTFANGMSGAISMGTSGSTSTDSRTLIIDRCNFINNKGSVGAIHTYAQTIITDSTFINNTATSASLDFNGIISVRHGGSLTISSSVFMGNKNTASSSSAISCIYAEPSEYDDNWDEIPQPTVIANDNFWGTNDKPDNKMVSDGITVNSWIVVVPTLKDEIDGAVTAENNHELTIEFKSTTDGKTFNNLSNVMPDVTLNLESTLGTITPTVTLTNNVGNATYKSSKEGSDKINVNGIGNTITSIEFNVTEDETGRIYVSTTGSDDTGDGSKSNPYATIEKAVNKNEELGGNQEIIVYGGTYVQDSSILIKKSVTITARGEVILSTSKYHFYISISSAETFVFTGLTFINGDMSGRSATIDLSGSYYNKGTLTLINCNFRDNFGDRIIGGSYFNIDIDNCTFINNSAKSNFIYGSSGIININNSVFYNNNLTGRYFVSGSSGVLDNNFWGTNDKPLLASGFTINSWIVLIPTISNDTILSGSTYDINLKFMLTKDGKTFSELNKIMPDLTVDVESVLGNTFSTSKVTISNNEGNFKYYATLAGMEELDIISFSKIVSLNFEVMDTNPDHIYVMINGSDVTGDGSKANPYRTIAKALSKATNGNCTIYVFDGVYYESALNITNNVTIMGRGDNVVIDANNTNYIFAVKANDVYVNITDMALINGKSNKGGAINIDGFDSELYVENVRFINNTATTSGAAIYMVYGKSIYSSKNKLTVIDCTFINGNSVYAGAIDTQAETIILNSIFKNNTASSDGAAIRMNGELLTITNSIFENNKAPASGSIIRIQSGSLDISYSALLDDGKIISSKYSEKVIADYNFWASNDKPTSKVDNGININNWIAVISTISSDDIYASEKATITSEFMLTKDGITFEALNKTMPDVIITYIPTIGGVNPSNVTMVNNRATTIYDATTEGNETVKITVNGNVLSELKFAVGESVADKIFVSSTIGDDSTGDGSRLKPYKTISRAVSYAKAGYTIIVYAGEYAANGISIYKNLTVIGIGDVRLTSTSSYSPYAFSVSGGYTLNLINLTIINNVGSTSSYYNYPGSIKLSGSSYSGNAKLVAVDCNFINCNSKIGAIYSDYGDIVLNRCNFINNTATGTSGQYQGIIALYGSGSINMSYCNFVNNNIAGNYLVYLSSSTITGNLNYNYWGSNDNPNSKVYNTKISNWVVLDLLIDSSDVYMGDINEITLKFRLTDGENITELDAIMPNLTVSLVPTIGSIDSQTVTISNNIGKTNYNSNVTGTEIINANVGTTVLNNLTFNVTEFVKLNSTIVISVDDIVVGEDAVITVVAPSDATGNVTVVVNGKSYVVNLTNGRATLKVGGLASGTYVISATYDGDGKYLASSNSTSFVVSKVDSVVSVSVDDIVVGEDAVIGIVVSDGATGNVTVVVNGKSYVVNLTDGRATLVIKDLTSGNYIINATYNGDNKFNKANAIESLTVNKISGFDFNVDVKVSEDVIINVVLPSDATGEIIINANNKNYTAKLINGSAKVVISDLTPGNYNISVIYSGDDKYESNKTNVLVNIPKLESPIDVDYTGNIFVGDDEIIKVILPGNATGTVVISVNGVNQTVNVVDGIAYISLSNLTAGNYVVNVKYNGDDVYLTNETSFNFSVSKVGDYIMNVTISVVDSDVIVDVILPSDANGNVIVSVDGNKQIVKVVNGVAKVNLVNLTAGDHTIIVSYDDDKYDTKVISRNITIIEPVQFVLTVPEITKYFNGTERLVANLVDGKGNPIVNASIKFVINGMTYIRITDEYGNASMAINLREGFYNVSVTYDNVSVMSNVTVMPTILADNLVKMYQNDSQFYTTILDSNGNPLANTTVRFNINGVFYYRNTTDKGVAKLNINLRPGTYIITVYNLATGEEKGFNVTVRSLIESSDLVKYYRNESQFNVKVYNKDGTLADGTNVTFNINGVFYQRLVTNGTAKLNINLKPGNYIITTMYDGLSVGNNVSVKPTLVTQDLSMSYKDGSTFDALVLDGQGNPLANQNVTFNVNGVFYNKITDENGLASLNINLLAGEYIITSIWNDYQVGNKITIA